MVHNIAFPWLPYTFIYNLTTQAIGQFISSIHFCSSFLFFSRRTIIKQLRIYGTNWLTQADIFQLLTTSFRLGLHIYALFDAAHTSFKNPHHVLNLKPSVKNDSVLLTQASENPQHMLDLKLLIIKFLIKHSIPF